MAAFALSLVIPVRDDGATLGPLLAQAAALGCFSEVIVVDDASDPPIRPDLPARLIRLAVPGGAGRARNIGLEAATGSHVMVFDADDRLLPALSGIVADLAGKRFDFCMFRHVDSRMRDAPEPGPIPDDEAFWQAAGATRPAGILTPAGARQLVRVAAYPWNKIYRTAFLRAHDLRCTEIPVHNDLELHWSAFLAADRIRYDRRPGCVHHVTAGGRRLTNRSGRERLAVYRAFEAVFARVLPDRVDYLVPLADFVLRLSDWIAETLEPELVPELRRLQRCFLAGKLGHAPFSLIALEDPALADRLLAVMEQSEWR